MTGLGERQSGQITLACVPTATFYFLPRAIERFNAVYPRIRFRILDLSSNDGLQSVSRGEAEFGINLAGRQRGGSDLHADDRRPLRAGVPPRSSARRRGGAVSWRQLQGHTLIGVSRASGNRTILENALVKQDVQLTFQYEVNHLTTSLGLVEQGLGVSVLPKLATPPDEHPGHRHAAHRRAADQRFHDMLLERSSFTHRARARAGRAPHRSVLSPA
jgi:DNA-binding transcriptional LysR family regulator